MLDSFTNRMLTPLRINIYIQEHNKLACFVLAKVLGRDILRELGGSPASYPERQTSCKPAEVQAPKGFQPQTL